MRITPQIDLLFTSTADPKPETWTSSFNDEKSGLQGGGQEEVLPKITTNTLKARDPHS